MSEPEHLGPYRIGKVIGRGGMGTVYAGQHVRSGEQVAVKLIAQHVAEDSRFRRRFDAEVEALKRLRHPNIVRLIGYGEEAGQLFYSMELVEGQSLQQRIREVKRFSWLPTLDIAIQVCSALKHAHDIGVLHRDLKPANLLLNDAGQIKLVDFGIAKCFGYGEQTMSGSVLGTADYMAPEQAGIGKTTARTDLYALGNVMYAMMTGRSPFAGKNLTKVIESVKHDRPVPLDLVNPDVPDDIVSLVHHLLEKTPEDRPPTALAVMNRLKAIRAGLQHERTVHLQSGSTKVGPESTEAQSPESGKPDSDTTGEPRTDGAVIISPDQPTSATGAKGSAGKTIPRSPQSPSTADAPDLSVAAMTMDSVVTEDSVSEPSRQTRFQTVDEQRQDSHWLAPSTNESPPWLSVVALSTLLFFMIGGAAYLYRVNATPSADRLYQRLATAQSSGDLTLETVAIEQFLSNYPEDERIAEVARWQDEVELEQTLRRFRSQARQEGGLTLLSAEIQSFVRAMDQRELSDESAQVQLQSWLDVFAPSNEKIRDVSTRRLADLVRAELQRLQSRQDPPKIDPRIESLQQRLEAARSLPADDQTRLLEGIITLYQQSPWAQPVVDQARQRLQAGKQIQAGPVD